MSGTKTGGANAGVTNKRKYGDDYYSRIGALGAETYKERQKLGIAKPRGFAANRELAKQAGKVGGRLSKRTKKVNSNG